MSGVCNDATAPFRLINFLLFAALNVNGLEHSTFISTHMIEHLLFSFQNISKLVLITSLIVLSVIDIVMAWRYNGSDYTTEIYTVNFVTPAVKLLTFVSIFLKKNFV